MAVSPSNLEKISGKRIKVIKLSIYRTAKKIIDKLCNNIILYHYDVNKGKNVNINGVIHVQGKKGTITIDDNVTLNSDTMAVPLGYQSYISFWCLDQGHIHIGEGSGISNATLCSANNITIGKNVLIGGGTKIFDTDFHSLVYEKRIDIVNDDDRRSAPVVIADGAFVGAGTIILKGVTIGEKSIIAAGAVVTKNIPAGEIWGGNPAKFIRKITN